MQPPVSCFQRLTNWWTGGVDQSARTRTTASIGGRRMRLQCGDSCRWSDQRYSACCFGGARAKLQRLRHNIAEIAQWPRADCNHFHDPQEWEPWVQDGQRHFPSAEESEYTAELCFAIATAASWWAVRVGHAKLYVPRSQSPSCTGHRDHWLDLDPRALREWAMTPP